MNRAEEHLKIRQFLLGQGSTFRYRRPTLPDPEQDYQSIAPVRIRDVSAPTPRPVRAPSPDRPVGPSALAFALLGAETPAPRPKPAPPPPASPAPPPAASPAAASSMNAFLQAPISVVVTRELRAEPISTVSAFLDDAPESVKELPFSFEERATPSLSAFLSSAGPPQERTNWVAKDPPRLDAAKDIIVNFETDGLDWNAGHEPVGVTVGTLDGLVRQYLPFAHRGGGNLDRDAVIRFLKSLRGKHIHNANTRFDLHMGRNIGVDFEAQDCTVTDIMHTAALLDDHRKQFAIDVLAADYLPGGVKVPRIDESRMADFHASYVARRAEYQAQLIAELHAVMYPQLAEQDLLAVQRLEDDVIYAVVEMEKNGAPLDLELLDQYHRECCSRHDRLLLEISQEAGFAFDHTNKTWKRLFEKLGLPIAKMDASDADSKDTFADGVIAKIQHPLVQKGRFASQLASLDSKTFKAYKEHVDSKGVLRFSLHQLRGEDERGGSGGTVTGRFSAGYIQQVPNHGNHAAVFGEELFPRDLFIPAPGNQYCASDAAQIQYRIFAHHANNPRIMAMYAGDPKASFHRMIEGMIRPYKPDLIYEHLKSMNFMKIFGGKLVKVAEMMEYITPVEAKQIHMSKTQRTDPRLEPAREIDRIYTREVPEIEPMLAKASHLAMSECDQFCNKTAESRMLHAQFPHRGYVRTIKKRRSRFPDNWRLHKAFCMIDQGSEGDIVKTKIVELHKARKHTGLLMRMTVHDELTGDAQMPETLERVDEILNQQSFPELRVPILWETKVGANWGKCK